MGFAPVLEAVSCMTARGEGGGVCVLRAAPSAWEAWQGTPEPQFIPLLPGQEVSPVLHSQTRSPAQLCPPVFLWVSQCCRREVASRIQPAWIWFH